VPPVPVHAIWHCDYYTYLVYELSYVDLSVIRSAPSPYTGPSGIGGSLDVIWHCDNTADEVYELSVTDFSIIRSASSPGSFPNGIGGDPTVIWHLDVIADKIYELSVTDFSVIRSTTVTIGIDSGIGGSPDVIWCGLYDTIEERSPADLSVIRTGPSTGDCHGIGGSTEVLYECDATADANYELSVVDFSILKQAPSPGTDPWGIGGK